MLGGSERYFSVYEGLKALEEARCDIVSIHDGARPMVDDLHIQRGIEDTIKYGASVLAVPVKDTIRFADEDGFGAQTPDRRKLWSIQTPQTFFFMRIVRGPMINVCWKKNWMALQMMPWCWKRY